MPHAQSCSLEAFMPLLPKMIDILFNSFTCDAVPGLSGMLSDLLPRD